MYSVYHCQCHLPTPMSAALVKVDRFNQHDELFGFCRADYKPAEDLLETEFLLKGRKYQRNDLEASLLLNCLM